jgi:hypothetical protein
VLAILRDGQPLVSPPGDLALAAGDQLRRLEKLIAAVSPA